MKYTLKVNEGKATISFNIPFEEWDAQMESAYFKNKHKYSQPGFRKGHVPRKVLEGIYGDSLFLEDAFNEAFPKYYTQALDEHKEIYPVEMPNVDFESFNADGFKFVAVVTLKPQITLGKYKGLKVDKVEAAVAQEEIDKELKSLQEKNSRLVSVERAVESGDEVTIDYSGSVGGKKFEGGTAQNQQLVIGSKSFIPGFEEGLIGMNKGEEKDITVTFPQTYHAKHLAGKEAVFAIKLHEIRVKQLQEINDDFAKDYTEFDTLDAYQADIKNRLLEQKQKDAKIQEDNRLLEEIVKNTPMEIPSAMIESQIDSYVEEFEYSLRYQGLKLDDYYKYTKSTKENLRESYKEKAKKSVETKLVFEALIKAENIKVDAKEFDAKVKELAKEADKTIKDFKATLNEEYTDYIKNQLLAEKVIEFLRKENTIA